MIRKKDDKRVLVSPRDSRQNNSRRKRLRRSRNNSMSRRNPMPRNNPKKKSARSGITVFLMILALLAFVIGAGIGISMSFDNGDDDGPHWVNVTKEMTSGLNETDPVIFDEELDSVDYNDNETLTEMNVTTEPGF